MQLKDTNGQFRDSDDVFLELAQKWNTLDRNAQRKRHYAEIFLIAGNSPRDNQQRSFLKERSTTIPYQREVKLF